MKTIWWAARNAAEADRMAAAIRREHPGPEVQISTVTDFGHGRPSVQVVVVAAEAIIDEINRHERRYRGDAEEAPADWGLAMATS